MTVFNFLVAVLLGLGACTALANGAAPVRPMSATQSQAHEVHEIQQAMKGLFDKPEATLTVNPVSIEGIYAIAGWLQDQRGGRALLQREQGRWRIALCGGDGLLQMQTLVQAGLPQSDAKRLVQKVGKAEAQLPANERKKLSSFDGIVRVEGGHGGHHAGKH